MAIVPALSLSEIGSFYVADRHESDEPVTRTYVQYFIPARARALPVLFVHGGGGLSGSCWETTPDGRPGWLSRFLRGGWPCYIVDNVGRGRAAAGPLPGLWEGSSTRSSDQQAWDVFRIGESQNRESATPFPDGQFPAEVLERDSLSSTLVGPTDVSPSVAALVATARRIGRCAIVSHSGGARFTAEVADLAPDVVVASVLIEPHTLPAGGPAAGISRQLVVGGDYLDQSPVWSIARDRWRMYRDAACAAGTPVEFWELPALGVFGNGHMMMMERNSDAIADLLMVWLEESDTSFDSTTG